MRMPGKAHPSLGFMEFGENNILYLYGFNLTGLSYITSHALRSNYKVGQEL